MHSAQTPLDAVHNWVHTCRRSLTTYDTKDRIVTTSPTPDAWRLTVKLRSHRALAEYMAFHRIDTAYELAQKAGLKPGVVGHLVSRRRNSCSLSTARAIEEALGCPPGFLFEARMSRVADAPRLSNAS